MAEEEDQKLVKSLQKVVEENNKLHTDLTLIKSEDATAMEKLNAMAKAYGTSSAETQKFLDELQKENPELYNAFKDNPDAMPDLKEKADKLMQATDELKQGTASVIQALTGHVSVQDAAKAAQEINKTYDKTVANLKAFVLGSEKDKKFIEEWTKNKVGENLFKATGAIKNGAVQGITGVSSFFSVIDTFKGSWRDPKIALQKLQTGVGEILTGTSMMAKCMQTLAGGLGAAGNFLTTKQGLKDNPLIQRAGIGLTGIAAHGDGPVLKNLSKLDSSKNIVSSAVGMGISTVIAKMFRAKEGGTSGGAAPLTPDALNEDDGLPTPRSQAQNSNIMSQPQSQTPSNNEDEKAMGEAEYVAELKFILDGTPGENNSECVVSGTEYLVSGYSLVQNMLSPMILSFSMIKKVSAEEVSSDVTYEVCNQIMGKDVEVQVTTKSFGQNARNSQFTFKGLITGISASRGTAGSPSIHVTASTYEYLLEAAPNCRSFENKTLKEIVNDIISPYEQLSCSINPRFKEPIPYIVQYNQSDYAFLTSLARRFGEWMYNDGTKFVFGELSAPSESVVRMRYPSGNIFGYGIDMQLRDFNFMHVVPDLYNFGSEVKYKTADGEADREIHKINESAFTMAKKLYKAKNICHLGTGGAFDNGESEGDDEILSFTTKVEARGKKAQMFVTNGGSKVAKLFLGQTFEIEDGVENTSGKKEEIKQKPLMVLSVSHSFDLNQEYSNIFEAIPSSCDYPPYSTADVFATAYPQRATVVDNQDPQRLGRVRVQFPWQKIQDTQMKSPWIRISQPYGGLSKGVQFIPEEGEEVMVGFEMDNAERPYVMGTLFNGTGTPDDEWASMAAQGSTGNNIKAIRTRSGHTIQFCDNGGGGDIQIYDYNKHNYLIAMSTDGKYIRIEAKGDVEIVAGNNITMKATKNIIMEAGENITVNSGKDTDISANANMSIAAENNMQQEATDIFIKAVDAISQESGNSYIIKTTKLQEKATGTASIDGGSQLEMTAATVKVR